jgi:hypothetical protein
MPLALVGGFVVIALLLVACQGGGETFQVTATGGTEETSASADNPNLSTGGEGSVSVGGPVQAGQKSSGAGDPKCATNSDPNSGFSATAMKWGTIIPLTGALRPLGEQTARVMKTATETWLNSITKIPGPYDLDWGCSQRPGIYGRKVSLDILSMQANTPEEALAHMRRHITSNKVFLVRDCYLQSNLMGPAVTYQNSQNVPGIWCSYSEDPAPALRRWNFSPGVDPLKVTGVHVGYLLSPNKLNKQRMAIIADRTLEKREVATAKKIAANFGKTIPDRCIVLDHAQEAQNGMEGPIAQIRGCYGTSGQPDAILAMDGLNFTFGALEAKDQGWTPDQVQWACLTCWVQAFSELCGDACTNAITDCQALPCIPWADRGKYPAAGVLKDTWSQYLTSDPQDILTFGPAAITGGLGLWLGMTGPDLSRDKFRNTVENLKNWDAGIGPILNTNPGDHYGGKSVWLIKFTGNQGGAIPWFADLTGRFVPLSEVGVPEGLTQSG